MTNKKIRLIFLLCAFFVIFGGFSVFAENESLKVGLYWGSTAKEQYSVACESGLSAGYYEDKSFVSVSSPSALPLTATFDSSFHILCRENLELSEAVSVADDLRQKGISAFVRYSNEKFSVAADSFSNENDCTWAAENLVENGSVLPTSSNFSVLKDNDGNIIFMSDTNVGAVSQNGKLKLKAAAEKEYRGGMMFFSENSSLTAVNVVDTEEYLYSVISKEMSPSWNKEALKAQAVCARCYAYNNRSKHKKNGFELCDSVCCQAYAGTSSETEQSYAPVDETKGQYLVYNEKVCETFYCSSTGPTTENVKYVWGSEYPYLVSVENPYEDYENVYNGKWNNTLTKQRATEIINSKNYNIGEVTEIKALEYSPSGRVIKLLVKGTLGEKTFERDACRSVFSEVTPSLYFTISGGGDKEYPLISLKSKNETQKTSAKNIKVISDSGVYSLKDGFCTVSDSQKKTYSSSQNSSDSYTFSGYGWGHGVGMSQYGAKGMAEAGFDYKAILTHYFPGSTVEKIGG